MALLKKDVTVPVLPPERVVSVPELGGEVIVRPLMLCDRLAITQETRNGPRKEYAYVASLLARAVVDGNGEQIFTADQWEIWGAQYVEPALHLWQEALAMAGFEDDEAEKNSKAQNSSSQ